MRDARSAAFRGNLTAPVKAALAALLACLLGPTWGEGPAWGGNIRETRHNFSVSGPGDLKASVESRICVFCHTPHFADPAVPLWNHAVNEGMIYNLYDSTTLQASTTQPDGPSRLCLSCHDGTIAIGQLGTGPVTLQGGVTVIPERPTKLDTDLADDHPIGIRFDDTLAVNDGQLRFPTELPPAIELRGGVLHCTSCHDPHDDTYGKFLTMNNAGSALCTACHQPAGWENSAHKEQDVHCQICHTPHNAEQPKRLLRGVPEEDTCLASCHNGTGPGANVQPAFNRASSHPVGDTQGVHDPAENPRSAAYHVECADCHNPHRANGDVPLVEGGVTGATRGGKGVDLAGNAVDPASYEYEICFKCHADNSFISLLAVPRQIEEINKRFTFDPNNPSYHPVTGGGKSIDVSSLRPGYAAGSTRISCHDCHNTADGSRAGGFGANGVHGSDHPSMLADAYWFETAGAAGPSWERLFVQPDYELCWRCHDPNILMATATFHDRHVRGRQTPCFVCHDPHGVPGAEPGNRRLINFTTLYGLTAAFDGTGCTASCHGGAWRPAN